MADRGEVEAQVLERLRRICLELPETVEEAAWVGVRWRVRRKTFADLLEVDAGWPPAYARLLGSDGPTRLLMFRSSDPELSLLRETGMPFLAPRWRADEVAMVLDDGTDWTEVGELLTESFVVQAPTSLASTVRRPPT